MNVILVGALMALSMPQQTDTTFAVGNAEILHVESMGGSIKIDTWDRNEIHLRAQHSSRTYIEVSRSRNHIDVEAEARRGPANLADFVITVPRRLGLRLEANYGEITVDGADGEVVIETVQGDISVRGGRGTVKLSNTTGAITVEGAQGQIEIESSAADVRIIDSGGQIFAETAGGTVVMQGIRATAVDVGSTGGRVHFEGTFSPSGTYFFGSHGGSVTIVVAEGARATFNVATVHGSITSNLDGQPQTFAKGERHSFAIGGGGALVEAETYGGRIRLLKAGSEGAQAPRRQARDARDGDAMAFLDGFGAEYPVFPEPTVMVEAMVAPVVSAHVAPMVAAAVAPVVSARVAPMIDIHVPSDFESAGRHERRPRRSATIRR